jgi:hypothetical protein
VIVRLARVDDIDALNPPPRAEMLECLPTVAGRVGKELQGHACHDEVEGFTERPVLFEIVDLEGQIRRHEARLDGTQIDPDDFRLGMLVCEVNRPDASAGPNVQHAMEDLVLRNRRRVQPPLEREEEDMVLEIQTVVLCLVVGEGIFPVL